MHPRIFTVVSVLLLVLAAVLAASRPAQALYLIGMVLALGIGLLIYRLRNGL
jgi:hypothetical protein